MTRAICLSGLLLTCVIFTVSAEEKPTEIRQGTSAVTPSAVELFARPTPVREASRTTIRQGDVSVPLVIVRGTPYEMGRQLGVALKTEIRTFIPPALEGILRKLGLQQEQLQEIWARTAAYADDRVEQELAGLADGSGIPLTTLQAMHAVPLAMPYSCSSIAAWGDATEDGRLYMTRNLDWSLEVGAHEFPVVVVYVPDQGIPHVVPTFAGFVGAHTGMNFKGIALAEMGDSPRREAPFFVHAPHFTVYFRTMLYDADSLTSALRIFSAQPLTKRYHFVFGDGRADKRAVKILAHAPEAADRQVKIWRDNDPDDEFAPRVLSCVVYNDEGRGAFPTLQQEYGKLNGEKLVQLANQIPIKGGNVVNVVYDTTGLRMWVSYAQGKQEAYQRPSLLIDLTALDLDQDGSPDVTSVQE